MINLFIRILVSIITPDQRQHHRKIFFIFHHLKTGLVQQFILCFDIFQSDLTRCFHRSALEIIVHDQFIADGCKYFYT